MSCKFYKDRGKLGTAHVSFNSFKNGHAMDAPRCFISYSWDNEAHQAWVRKLATRLRQNGIDAILDQFHCSPGTDLTKFMEKSVRESSFVLLVCTPTFAQKADTGAGGVGYEKAIVTGEIFAGEAGETKFIPLLREGDAKQSLPSYLKSRLFVDFREDVFFENRLEDLLRHFYGEPLYPPPPVGQKPKFRTTLPPVEIEEAELARKEQVEPKTEPPKPELKEQRPAEAPIDETKLAEPTPSEPKPSITKPLRKSSGTKIGVLVALAVVVVAGVMLLLWQDGREPTLEKFTNSIGMEFVLIPAGSFTMGSSTGDKDEKPPHNVKISQSFYLQTTEITQGQWKKVMGDNPSSFKQCGDDCPVESVSWEDAKRFIEKLNKLELTKGYRLPSEAEWEYACRAGTSTEFLFGDDASKLGRYAWYSDNSSKTTQRVAGKKPNPWGLYDMYGNVWEWVEDDWHDSYDRAPDDGRAWVDNPRGSDRVMRGGSWYSDAQDCRSATRSDYWPDARFFHVGFRLSRSVALGP